MKNKLTDTNKFFYLLWIFSFKEWYEIFHKKELRIYMEKHWISYQNFLINFKFSIKCKIIEKLIWVWKYYTFSRYIKDWKIELKEIISFSKKLSNDNSIILTWISPLIFNNKFSRKNCNLKDFFFYSSKINKKFTLMIWNSTYNINFINISNEDKEKIDYKWNFDIWNILNENQALVDSIEFDPSYNSEDVIWILEFNFDDINLTKYSDKTIKEI